MSLLASTGTSTHVGTHRHKTHKLKKKNKHFFLKEKKNSSLVVVYVGVSVDNIPLPARF